MNFLELLILSRKMEFKEDGEVTLYSQDIVVLPDALMAGYISKLGSSPEWKKAIYSTARDAMLEHKEGIGRAYRGSSGSAWVCNTVNLLGQGKITYEDADSCTGTVWIENAPTARELVGKVNGQTEHILRGLVAGIASAVLGQNVEAVEVECVATGSDRCKLVVGPEVDLKARFPEACAQQV